MSGRSGADGLLGGVMTAVKAHIRENGLQVGDSLPSEGALAEKLGVSRSVVREAYRSLSALTLIDIGNGRRPRVAAPKADVLALVTDHAVHTDQVTIQQIFDVRRTVERRTVVLAAMRRTDKEAAEIVALAEAMQRDFDQPVRVMEHDIAFHEAIGMASRTVARQPARSAASTTPPSALISATRSAAARSWRLSRSRSASDPSLPTSFLHVQGDLPRESPVPSLSP